MKKPHTIRSKSEPYGANHTSNQFFGESIILSANDHTNLT